MKKIIVNCKGLSNLFPELVKQGCDIEETNRLTDKTDLTGCIAYIIDMHKAIKKPVKLIRLKRFLNKNRIPIVVWNRDSPWHKGTERHRLWMLKFFKILDVYLAHSMQDSKGFAPHIKYFPNAANIESYNLAGTNLDQMRDPSWYKYDVSFFGNIDDKRYNEMAGRVEFLNKLKPVLRKEKITALIRDSKGLTIPEQIEIIQHSRINLNCGAATDCRGKISWGLPERCYGTQACGGFLLSDDRKHAGEDFNLENEWAFYTDFDDCVKKIKYYLANFSRARDIAEQAHKKILTTHTYSHRAIELLEVIQS